MSTKSIAQYLEFANLQIAAEAFYDKIDNRPNWESNNNGNISYGNIMKDYMLLDGNNHTSKFSPTLAAEFTQKWKMVAHIANTGAGFSGTLFEALDDIPGTEIKKGDLTLSFRSTEFVEDAVRDNRATNKLEINDKGFAFGQIADMRAWVHAMQDAGVIKNSVSVTGYSLGAHLATAFYQLQSEGDFVRGNHIIRYGTVKFDDETVRSAADVWFAINPAQTVYLSDTAVRDIVKILPCFYSSSNVDAIKNVA